MKYSDNYVLTHDIDWFCTINGHYIHFASNGGFLPNEINDRNKLREIQSEVSNGQIIYSAEDILYNEEFLRDRFGENFEARENYINSFREMAQKGFISFDRTNFNDPYDHRYHMVCRPRIINNDYMTSYNILELQDITDSDIIHWILNSNYPIIS